MIEFIEEVEAAEKGSVELSKDVLLRLGWSYSLSRDIWFKDGFGTMYGRTSSVTQYIDIALRLLPPGYNWLIHDGSDLEPSSGGFVGLRKKGETGEHAHTHGRAATPALALCSAILRVAEEEAMQELSDLGQEIDGET